MKGQYVLFSDRKYGVGTIIVTNPPKMRGAVSLEGLRFMSDNVMQAELMVTGGGLLVP